MHFRIYDLAADRCVWSIPPIDTVPVKLLAQKLVVRAIDNDGGIVEVTPMDGVALTAPSSTVSSGSPSGSPQHLSRGR
jgi:hypothetical protein